MRHGYAVAPVLRTNHRLVCNEQDHFDVIDRKDCVAIMPSIQKLFVVLALSCLAILTTGEMFAQATVGIQPLGSYANGGVDQINQANLGVHIDIPLFVHKGRGGGLGTNVHLIYDSTYAPGSNPVLDFGWRLTGSTAPAGTATMSTTDSIWEPQCNPPTQHCNIGCYYNTYSFSFTDSTGFPHLFPDGNAVVCHGVPGTIPLNEIEWDGESSGYLLSATSSGTFVSSPSGDVYNLGKVMTDPNGNSGSTTLPGETWSGYSTTLTDDSNVSATITGGAYSSSNYNQWTSRSPLTVRYTDTTGAPRTATVNYGLQTVSYTCPLNGFNFSQQAGMVQSIVFPDGSAYHFTYFSDGALQSMQLPTGATINYPGNDGISASCSPGLPATMSRQTPDGTTTYSQSITSMNGGYPATSTTTINHPDGSWESIDFAYALNGQSSFLQNLSYETAHYWYSSSNALLKSTMKCYNGATGDCTTTLFSIPISEIATTTILDTGQSSKLVQFLNNAALVTEIDEYDFGASSPTRKTLTNYASLSNNIYDHPSSVTVYNSSGTQMSQTTYNYDEGSLTATSGLPDHSSVSGSRGNLTSQHQWLNTTGGTLDSHWTYDDAGQKLSAEDPRLNTTTFGYDSATDTCRISTTPPTPPSGVSQGTSATCDPYVGLTATTTDANSVKTTYSYDSMLRPLGTTVKTPSGSTVAQTTISYSGSSLPETITTTVSSSPSPNETSTVTLDGLGRTSTSVSPNGATVATTYNSMGYVQSVSNPYITTGDSTYGITSYLYDGLGRKTYQCQPDNTTSNPTTCSPSASYQSWAYSGNAVTFTDEVGNQWKRWTDGLGRLTEVMEPNGSSTAPSMETDYSYDALNNLLSVNQKGLSGNTPRARSFTYDSLSRLLTATNPESGQSSYTYDADDNVVQKTVPAPNSTTVGATVTLGYSYDNLNRLCYKFYTSPVANCPSSVPSSAVAAFFYDSSTLSGAANTAGRLTSEETLNGGTAISERYTYAYDALGRLRSEKQCPMGTCFVPALITCPDGVQVASYCYDEAGNVYGSNNMLSGTNGIVFSYGYDSGGRLTSQTSTPNSGSATTLFQSNSYGAAGLLGAYLGGSSSPAVTMSRAFDRRFRLLSESDTGMTPSGSGVIYSYSVPSSGGYLANGNLSNFTDSVVGTWSMASGYDTLNRLTAVHSTSGPYSGGYGCWTYDAFGNRKLEAYSNATSTPCATGANDNLQQTTTNPATNNQISGLQYDVAGNLLYDGVNNYAYDTEGRLCAVAYNHTGSTQYTQYVYDAGGRRIAKGSASNLSCSVPGGFTTTNLFLLGQSGVQVTETNGAGSAIHSDAWAGGGSPLATYDFVNGGLHYELTDWLGTKRVQVAGSGTKIGYAELDCFSLPFGNDFGNTLIPNCTTPPGSPAAADATEHHFTGKEHDIESGNDYFEARYYASSTGRFLSPDWSIQVEPVPYAKLDNPQSLNLYAYVYNNPLALNDPDGHSAATDADAKDCEAANNSGNYCSSSQPDLGREQNSQASTPQTPSAQQQSSSSKGTSLWHGLSNLFHGHSWNYGMRPLVTHTFDFNPPDFYSASATYGFGSVSLSIVPASGNVYLSPGWGKGDGAALTAGWAANPDGFLGGPSGSRCFFAGAGGCGGVSTSGDAAIQAGVGVGGWGTSAGYGVELWNSSLSQFYDAMPVVNSPTSVPIGSGMSYDPWE